MEGSHTPEGVEVGVATQHSSPLSLSQPRGPSDVTAHRAPVQRTSLPDSPQIARVGNSFLADKFVVVPVNLGMRREIVSAESFDLF